MSNPKYMMILTGHVVIYQPLNNYAVVMTDICEYEMMTVECFLSEKMEDSIMAYCDKCGNFDEVSREDLSIKLHSNDTRLSTRFILLLG